MIKHIPHFESNTEVQLLCHIQYRTVLLIFLLSGNQYKYSDTGHPYWSARFSGTRLRNTDSGNRRGSSAGALYYKKAVYLHERPKS